MFHKNLKKIRQSSNLTQKQAANGINVTERVYQRYENGECLPSYKSLFKIAEYFSVSIDFLVGRTTVREVSRVE
jgi:transcriptional regulator with XRE-family HTH domain